MRYYTKEWHKLLQQFGNADLFLPVEDKEYSDEEIAELFGKMMARYVREEREAYEDAEEPFDEDESKAMFEEMYNDSLEEPDEDLPSWILETVDPRLVAMGALPEPAYKRLLTEEQEVEARFDELDEAAEDAIEEMYEKAPDDYTGALEEFDDIESNDVVAINSGKDLEIEFDSYDEDGEPVLKRITFENAEIIEDEGLALETEEDEEGDVLSNCSLLYHEVYFEDENGRIEVHMLFDNEDHGLKYLTLLCDDFWLEQESAE